MTVPNQVTHRANFRKQEAAGAVARVGGKRHGQARTRVRPATRIKRKQQPPRGVPGGKTLAEMLGIKLPPKYTQKPKPVAQPLAPLAPPPTANVPELAKPDVVIDPPVASGELPPVIEIKTAPAAQPPVPQAWPKPEVLPPATEEATETGETTKDEESGDRLI